MKRGKLFFFSLFLVMIPVMFTSCMIGELFVDTFDPENKKSHAVFSQLDDGGKVAKTKRTLNEAAFQGSNFFINDTPNKNFTDLNVQIFNLIKKNLKDGCFCPYDNDKEHEKYVKKWGFKEAISYWPSDGTIIFYKEFQEKDGKKGTMAYGFAFDINQQAYKEWSENSAYIKKCDDQIESFNWIIDNCSAETIVEQKIVQVPYKVTKKRWVPGDSGIRAGSGTEWTYTEGTPGHYEEYTAYTEYRNEVQYYEVANPNYNPAKVAQAKQNLPSWQNSKTERLEKMKYLPFSISVINLNLGHEKLDMKKVFPS